jgi:hypothetical protein
MVMEHVAGIAAGNGKNVKGVAPDALLINAKVLDDRGNGDTASIVAGIYWALNPDNDDSTDDGADVLILSLGAPTSIPDTLMSEALQNAINYGVVVVAAAGNCGESPSRRCRRYQGVAFPGSLKSLITVGSVNNNLEYASFSSGQEFSKYTKPDVVAPGVGVTSSIPGGYSSQEGTSVSAPFIAGIAAVLLSQNPDLTHYEIKQLLEENAIDLGIPGKDAKYGSGFVNLSSLHQDVEGVEEEIAQGGDGQTGTNVTVQYGGNLPEEAHSLTFGTEEDETFWTEGASNWYHTTTSEQGTLYFGIKNIELGSDFILNVYDYQARILLGSSDASGKENELVTVTKNNRDEWGFYMNVIPKRRGGLLYTTATLYTGTERSCQASLVTQCYEGDEYNYDSCGNRKDKQEECGEDNCDAWQTYCKEEKVHKKRTCSYKGCAQSACYTEQEEEDEFVEQCPQGCQNGACMTSTSTPEGNIIVESITSISPFQARPGQEVTITVRVKNVGGQDASTHVESAVVPASWAGTAYPHSSYGTQAVYDNLNPPCPGNTFYASKLVSLHAGESENVHLTVTAPTPETQDACNHLGSAWDEQFRAITGAYQQPGQGYTSFTFQPYTLTQEGCGLPDGSRECSCPAIACPVHYQCIDGACQNSQQQEECSFPDGSSEQCDCNSNSQCPQGYTCDLGPGWDACVEEIPEDECAEIDTYTCHLGSVYRCEQFGRSKKRILVSVCSEHEICPANVDEVKQCVTKEYNLVLEHAPSGVTVYKNVGDFVQVTIKVKQATGLQFTYDTTALELVEGSCERSRFSTGTTHCTFKVLREGRHTLQLEDDVEIVEGITNTRAGYITQVRRLQERFA